MEALCRKDYERRVHRVKESFNALAEHFELPWRGKMELAADAWEAHGLHQSELRAQDLFDKSRLAGAINILSACATIRIAASFSRSLRC